MAAKGYTVGDAGYVDRRVQSTDVNQDHIEATFTSVKHHLQVGVPDRVVSTAKL
jgi:hypothetical protein